MRRNALQAGSSHSLVPPRILQLTSDRTDTQQDIWNFYLRLRNHGYSHDPLVPLFQSVHKKILRCLNMTEPVAANPDDGSNPGCIFFHIPYNNLDPSRRCFQDLFRACLLQPGNEDPLPYLRNNQGESIAVSAD
jgi:hypothetical protein